MSKLMTEYMLRGLGAASDLRYVILRYFNGRIGSGRSYWPIDPRGHAADEGRGRTGTGQH